MTDKIYIYNKKSITIEVIYKMKPAKGMDHIDFSLDSDPNNAGYYLNPNTKLYAIYGTYQKESEYIYCIENNDPKYIICKTEREFIDKLSEYIND